MQAEHGQAGPVEDAGPGGHVGPDPFQPAGAGLAPAPGSAGEVGDLALDDGAVGPVSGLPLLALLGGLGPLQRGFVGVDGSPDIR